MASKPAPQCGGLDGNLPEAGDSRPASQSLSHGGSSSGMNDPSGVGTGPNKEWDLCVRKGTLTVGAGMLVGAVLGTLFGADLPLLWGTGAGILWSVKRCRALMRDGIMTPEMERARREQKRFDRIQKRKETEEKIREATSKRVDPKEQECCKKLKEQLELQKKKESELLKKLEDSTCDEIKQNKTQQDKLKVCEGSSKTVTRDSTEPCSVDFVSTTTVKVFPSQSRRFSTQISACGTDLCLCAVKDGKTVGCPACNSLVSSQIVPELPQLLKSSADSIKDTENSGETIFTMNGDNASEGMCGEIVQSGSGPESSVNPSDLLILQDVNTNNDESNDEVMDNHHLPILARDDEHELQEEVEFEDVMEIKGDYVEIIVLDGGTYNENIEEVYDNNEISTTSTKEEFAQKIRHRDSNVIEADQKKEEIIFVETYKSESWPFSFSLPSLDKFQKKSDSTFKWPPLPSSIIVKPKKEPPCSCQKEDTIHIPTEPVQCTCGLPEENYKCPG